MTPELRRLLRDLGNMAATVRHLDDARDLWAMRRDKSRFPAHYFLEPADYRLAAQRAVSSLRVGLPDFLYGIFLSHSYNLFEHYLLTVLQRACSVHPAIIANILTSANAASFLATMTPPHQKQQLRDKALRKLGGFSIFQVLEFVRSTAILSGVRSDLDLRLVQLSLMRNCIVHNRSRTSDKLEYATARYYKQNDRIHVDANTVTRGITVFILFTSEVDMALKI